MAALLALTSLAVSACETSSSAGGDRNPPSLRAPRIVGPLHTVGTRIIDARGRQVRLISIQLGGMATGVGSPARVEPGHAGCEGWRPPPASAYATIARWGFNTVRIAISWANLQPRPPTPGRPPAYDTAYLRALDTIVHGFTRRGIAVVIEMAQNKWSPAFSNIRTSFGGVRCRGVGMPAWLYPNGTTMGQAQQSFYANTGGVQNLYARAWQMVARRYAQDPLVVGFDIMNEPYTYGLTTAAGLHLNTLYRRVGSAIRSVNPSALLIFQDSNWAPGGSLALAGAPPFPNEVYEFHLYEPSWTPGGLARTTAYLSRATRWGVPLWIGEFDAFNYASPYPPAPRWQTSLRQMMRFCKVHDIGWSEFTFAPKWVLAPGTDLPRAGLMEILRLGV